MHKYGRNRFLGLAAVAPLLLSAQAILLAPGARAATEGDIVFIVDESSSMGGVQTQVRNHLTSLTNQIDMSGIDARYSLVGYGNGGGAHGANSGHTHTDLTTLGPFQTALTELVASGGTEPAFAAIVHSDTLSFRPNAKACFVLITDEDADAGVTQASAQATLTARHATFFGIFNPNSGSSSRDFDPLATATGGQNFALSSFVGNPDPVLDALGAACAAAIGGAISLSPASATNDVGTPHAVTATVRDTSNRPIPGTPVTFTVVSGPNTGAMGACTANADCTADAAGQVTFTYTGMGKGGTDTIEACFNDAAGARRCATATKLWHQRTQIRINDVSVTEGDAGMTPAVFTLSLDAASPSEVTVTFATVTGTALAGSDYVGTNGTATFPPDTTTQQVAVLVNGDTTNEDDETFVVNLSDPTNATIADGRGTGTILDDDRDGQFSCRASAVRMLGNEPLVANPANLPCLDDAESLSTARLNTLAVQVSARTLTATTDQTPQNLEATNPAPGDTGVAVAQVEEATVRVGPVIISAAVLRSEARVECIAGPAGLGPRLSGFSELARLTINGMPLNVSGSTTIGLPFGLGSVSINRQASTPTSLTQQAVRIQALGMEVVMAEVRVNVAGDPCTV
jgi:hypothetical protein